MHKLVGSFRQDRHGDRADAHDDNTAHVERPAWLSAKADKYWDHVVSQLAGTRIASSRDSAALAILCESIADYITARTIVENEGMLVDREGYGPVPHPAIRIQQKAWEQVMKGLQQFGMTPVSRSMVKVSETRAVEDGKAKFFNTG